MLFDLPVYKKQLPQVWLEDGKFIIESDSFRYVIEDDLKLLFKLCRRFKSDAIAQTYATNWIMNYTLKQLQDRVNSMIKEQGEDAECGAWIFTKNDCHLKDEDGNTDYGNNVEDPALIARIFDDVGNIDYIYQVIQESVDEVVEEQLMQYQQELVEVSWVRLPNTD